MLDRLSPTKRNVALGVLAVLLLWFFWSVRAVLNPLILGYLLAFIVHPMVRRLQARGWKRRSAVNVLFVGGQVPPCEDAADADDSGQLNLSDSITTLSFLFVGAGVVIPSPGTRHPWFDPTPDALTCGEGARGD